MTDSLTECTVMLGGRNLGTFLVSDIAVGQTFRYESAAIEDLREVLALRVVRVEHSIKAEKEGQPSEYTCTAYVEIVPDQFLPPNWKHELLL